MMIKTKTEARSAVTYAAEARSKKGVFLCGECMAPKNARRRFFSASLHFRYFFGMGI